VSHVRQKGERVRGDCRQGGHATPLLNGKELRSEPQAVAALNNVELISALISFNWQLALVGLQLRILNWVVSLLTTEVHNKALAAY
jgi:hypothetical protein